MSKREIMLLTRLSGLLRSMRLLLVNSYFRAIPKLPLSHSRNSFLSFRRPFVRLLLKAINIRLLLPFFVRPPLY